MNDSERCLLIDVRCALLHFHMTLFDWERAVYERLNGRTSAGEMLKVLTSDPQFAWLRLLSELIVRIDLMLDTEPDYTGVDVNAVVSQAQMLVIPDEAGSPYARCYHIAL